MKKFVTSAGCISAYAVATACMSIAAYIESGVSQMLVCVSFFIFAALMVIGIAYCDEGKP